MGLWLALTLTRPKKCSLAGNWSDPMSFSSCDAFPPFKTKSNIFQRIVSCQATDPQRKLLLLQPPPPMQADRPGDVALADGSTERRQPNFFEIVEEVAQGRRTSKLGL